MPAWLDNIMSPLNTAGDTLQKLIETRDLVKFGNDLRKSLAEVIAAQRAALTAQTNEATLLERIRELEEKVRGFETWEREKERYQLVALAPNVMAYAVKPTARGPEHPDLICANCYNAGKKSFLNQATSGSRLDQYQCNGCGEVLNIHKGSGGPTLARRDYDIFNP